MLQCFLIKINFISWTIDACSPNLVFRMAEAISYEVRAQWNNNKKAGKYSTFMGLSCFSPVINILRHPLWGRNQVGFLQLSNVNMAVYL